MQKFLTTVRDTQLAYAGDGPGVIVNRDIANGVLLGTRQGFNDFNEASVLDALTFFDYSGDVDVWGRAQSGNPLVDILQIGASNWAPSPAQSAAQLITAGLATSANQLAGTNAINNPAYGPSTLARQILQEQNIPANIAIAGVPLLNAADQFTNTSNTTVGSGATFTFGPWAVTKPGYALLFNCHSAAGTNTFIRLSAIWTDSGSGLKVNQQSWYFLPGADSTTNLHSIRGQGPTEADTLSIQVAAFNNSVVVDQILVHQVSYFYPRHDFRTFTAGNFAGGLSGANSDLQAMLLVNLVANLATGTHSTIYAPLYAGRAQIWAQTASNTTDLTLTLNAFTDQSANLSNPPNNIYQAKSDGGGELNDQILVPRCQMQIVLNNGNAATKQLSLNITMSDG